MAMVFPELVIESVLHEEFAAIRENPTLINEVFGWMLSPKLEGKHGPKRIKQLHDRLQKASIPVVFAYAQVPRQEDIVVSIQTLSDAEDRPVISDYSGQVEDPVEELVPPTTVVSGITLSEYDPNTGRINLAGTSDLSEVYPGLQLLDSGGTTHTILPGIIETPGSQKIFVEPGSVVQLSGEASVQTPEISKGWSRGAVINRVTVLIGIHSREAHLAMAIYALVKWALLRRRQDLGRYQLQNMTLVGSNFQRSEAYGGDVNVHERFLTLECNTVDFWVIDSHLPASRIDVAVSAFE